ncbi:MAG: glycosyltransferase family 4 protein [Schlesneria sp.]
MPFRRIAIVFEFSTLNGGERSMLAVLDGLKANDSKIEFVAIGPGIGRLADALRERQIPLHDWSLNTPSGVRRPAEEIENSLCQLINSIKPDLVHANSLAMGRLLGRVASRLKMPTTGHLRDIIKLSVSAIADLNRNQKLAAVSEATRNFHVGQGLDGHRLVVVHNGIDLDQFQPRSPIGWLHAELGLNRKNSLVACIGQIGLRKGQDILAAAAPDIMKQAPNTHFLLIGERTSQKAESIEFEQTIRHRFDEAGLSNHLHLLGNREDVAEIMGEIDLLVHPANQEPFGRVLLEASAAGVPIVATNVGGTSEIVLDGVTGRLIPPKDPIALAESVIKSLTDKTESQHFRLAARKRAIHEFSINVAAQKLSAFWNEILEQQHVKKG